MRNPKKNKFSFESLIYESPEILKIELYNDIITNSLVTDPDEGEWDVEG